MLIKVVFGEGGGWRGIGIKMSEGMESSVEHLDEKAKSYKKDEQPRRPKPV